MPKRKRKTETVVTQESEGEDVPMPEVIPQEPEKGEGGEVIGADELQPQEPIQEIEERVRTLSAHQLLTVRDLVEKYRKRKVEEAKQKVLAEMKGKLTELGLSLSDITSPRRTTQKKTPSLRVKYRSPNGDTWSGTGLVPNWLKQLEAEGHSREEYAVTAPIGSHMGK
jgi:DNA-binding protein H-NS